MRTLTSTLGLSIALCISSCSSNKHEQSADYMSADSAAVQAESVANLPQQDAKLVKTASMDFKVKDVYQSSARISEAAVGLGGLVTHHDINSSLDNSKSIPLSNDSSLIVSSYVTHAEMYVRVPSAKLEEFMRQVASQATFINKSNLDIDDRSIDYLAQTLKQQSRQKIVGSQVEKNNLKTKDALTLADEQDKIINQKTNNLYTDAAVKYSMVQLSFLQNAYIRKESIANNDLNSYQSPFYKRLGDALVLGCIYFGDLLVGIAHLWAFILLGILGWLSFRFYKGKKKFGFSEESL